jgi:hypothetical protein
MPTVMLADIKRRSHARLGKSRCKRLMFLWVVRNTGKFKYMTRKSRIYSSKHKGHIDWISSDLSSALACAPESLDVVVQVHVTGPNVPSQSVASLTPSSSSEEPDKEDTLASTSMLTLSGRPDLYKIFADEAETARGGRMSVSGECLYASNTSIDWSD